MKHPLAIITFVILAAILAWPTAADATKIKRLPVSELEKRATHIVIGEVVEAESLDEQTLVVKVKSGTTLKGEVPEDSQTFQVTLRTQGRKAFDPELEVGDIGVFFLDTLEDGEGDLAHWGSIAIFDEEYLYDVEGDE